MSHTYRVYVRNLNCNESTSNALRSLGLTHAAFVLDGMWVYEFFPVEEGHAGGWEGRCANLEKDAKYK